MIKNDIEALLFVSKDPLTVEQIVSLLEREEEHKQLDKSVVIRYLRELEKDYEDRGIQIRQVAGGFEMVSSKECFETISKIVKKEAETLPNAALETVSVVAYEQPISRAEIGRQRKRKNPDHGIESALAHGLIEETEEGYITTKAFLTYFGINDLHELPPRPKLEIQTEEGTEVPEEVENEKEETEIEVKEEKALD